MNRTRVCVYKSIRENGQCGNLVIEMGKSVEMNERNKRYEQKIETCYVVVIECDVFCYVII